MEVEHEALMRQSMQPRDLKWNKKTGVLNGSHGEMWIVRDCKYFSKRWNTLIWADLQKHERHKENC